MAESTHIQQKKNKTQLNLGPTTEEHIKEGSLSRDRQTVNSAPALNCDQDQSKGNKDNVIEDQLSTNCNRKGDSMEKENSNTDQFIQNTKKNLLVLSIGWMFFFMPFFSLRSLQSSMNHMEDLGLTSLASIYTGFLLGCFTTVPIIKTVGMKRTLILGVCCHLVFVVSNVYTSFYTIIPASLIAGFAQAAMWTAQGSYLVKLSLTASQNSTSLLKNTANLYFGIFFFFYSLSPVLGSLLTSLVMNILTKTSDNVSNIDTSSQNLSRNDFRPSESMLRTNTSLNLSESNIITSQRDIHGILLWLETHNRSAIPKHVCGLYFCHKNVVDNEMFVMSLNTRIIVLGTFVFSMILAAAILAIFLDSCQTRKVAFDKSQLVVQTKELFRLMKEPTFLLLMPLIFYHGIQTSFYSGEITKAFVTCFFGMAIVGYSMACFGCTAALASYATGYVKRWISRKPIILLGFCLNLSCLITFLVWMPTEESVVGVLVIVCLWGIADGIWITHLNCVTGLLFPHRTEVAYAGFQVTVAVGMIIGYSTSSKMCMLPKIVSVGVLGLFGILCFLVLNWKIRQTLKL